MHMNKRVRGDVCLILCGVLVWFLADAKQLRLEAAGALALCAGTVIPALFPFMAVAGMLVRLGFGQWLAPYMAGLTAPLFRLPGCAGSALLLGLVGRWLWRKYGGHRRSESAKKDEPHFKGPVYTVDYKEVKDDDRHKE